MNLFLRRTIAAMMLTVSSSWAAFQDVNWGARPVGIGGAFTAIADDANAPLYNPAGIVQVQWNELSASYSRLFGGLTLYSGEDRVHLNQSYLSFVSKPYARVGSFGLSWSNFSTTHLYKEDAIALTYARNVGDFITPLGNDLSAGVNLKFLRRSFTLDAYAANDPVFAGGSNSASAFAADLGLLYKPEDGVLQGWRLGFSGQNLNQPDVGFKDKDEVPVTYRLGAAYQSKNMPWLVPSLDGVLRDGILNAQGGFESWLFQDTIGLRAGGNRQEAAMGLSYYYSASKRFGFRLDYGLTIPYYVSDTNGSHRLGLTVYF